MTIRDDMFYWACAGFAAGVLARSFFYMDAHAAVIIMLVALASLLCFSFIIRQRALAIASVFILAAGIGIFRAHVADAPAPEIFTRSVGHTLTLQGTIVQYPTVKPDAAELIVRAENSGAAANILLFAKNDTRYRYGDAIAFTGKLETPKNFLTAEAKEFDYVNYLKNSGIFFVVNHPKVIILARGEGNGIQRALFALREKISDALGAAIPEPESSLARGLLLGERASFDPSLRQAFIDTGLIHIVTLSGYHITVVAQGIALMLGFLPATAAAAAGLLAVFLYIIMTGGAQTAIRAGIMAALALLATYTGRIYDTFRALIVTGVVMVLVKPSILAFDASFALSFLATLAVIVFVPKLEPHFAWIPWKRIRNITAITSSVYLVVLPYLLYRIGNLSLVALPANIAVLPVIPAAMLAGFATAVAGMFSYALAIIPAIAAYLLLHYELAVIGAFAHVPFAALTVPNFPLALVIVVYAPLFFYIVADAKKIRAWSRLAIPLAALAVTLVAAGALSYRHYAANLTATRNMHALLASAVDAAQPFIPDTRKTSGGCNFNGPLPDHACTPGALFSDATLNRICVRGYTATVRNVSTKLRQNVYEAYDVAYPEPRGTYEVDHLIPLALGGSNDIANLWPEAAEPIPGFHEKDLVEVYLQQEVCAGRVALPAAERQIANDWLAVYNNLTPEQILALKQKYGGK